MDPDGIACRCGKSGCLETIVGNYGILRRARAAAQKGLWQPRNPQNITIDEVLQAARNGEACLQKIYAGAGRALGIGISNLVGLFNPARIFISGKGTLAGDLLFNTMYDAIPRFVSGKLNGSTEVIVKNWSQRDYARGSGAVVLQEIYKSPANSIVPII